MTERLKDSIPQSALWAAYGDALGFITELADRSLVRKRVGMEQVRHLVPWKRRIGGRFGVEALLPAGAYSDDTQLRLATGRAIQADGHFDVDAFSKVELPVWLSYALGAGRATTTAAGHLSRRDTQWFGNFYSEKELRYVTSGGNGAAMRIQPHVWASATPATAASFVIDVIKNAVCTHGHARAIAGAVFHSVCLGRALGRLSPPSAGDLREAVELVRDIPLFVKKDSYLNDFWAPRWEEESGQSLTHAYADIAGEMSQALKHANAWVSRGSLATYSDLVSLLRLDDPKTRGAGTSTAIAASVVSMLLTDRNADDLLFEVVNALGTDTDSIATMAGAIIGAVVGEGPPEQPQDAHLIVRDAERLFDISRRRKAQSFQYPSLLSWEPPRTALDSLSFDDEGFLLAALGRAHQLDQPIQVPASKGAFAYQWLELELGQTVLVKRRMTNGMPPVGLPSAPTGSEQKRSVSEVQNTSWTQPMLGELEGSAQAEAASTESSARAEAASTTAEDDGGHLSGKRLDIDQLTDAAIQSRFDSALIGEHILALASGPEPVDRCVAYAAIISKAFATRKRRQA